MSRPEETERDLMGDPDRMVVRDKRRLDPESGQVREPGPAAAEPAGSPPPTDEDGQPVGEDLPAADLVAELIGDDARVAELTADLQRVSAEYANYRKRVDRDRVAVVEMATAGVLSQLLPLLDDIERARQHGDLSGAFKGVGEGLEALTVKLGLERFGEPGEPFDPAVHEALMPAEPDPASTVATCAQVLQPGFRLSGGRILRPARVSVAEPGADPPGAVPAAED